VSGNRAERSHSATVFTAPRRLDWCSNTYIAYIKRHRWSGPIRYTASTCGCDQTISYPALTSNRLLPRSRADRDCAVRVARLVCRFMNKCAAIWSPVHSMQKQSINETMGMIDDWLQMHCTSVHAQPEYDRFSIFRTQVAERK